MAQQKKNGKSGYLKMNRPSNKGLHYNTDIDGYAFNDYIENLEKYCDELEKALDKASEKLKQEEASNCYYCDFGHSGADVCDMECWHKSKWKEWLLKDE